MTEYSMSSVCELTLALISDSFKVTRTSNRKLTIRMDKDLKEGIDGRLYEYIECSEEKFLTNELWDLIYDMDPQQDIYPVEFVQELFTYIYIYMDIVLGCLLPSKEKNVNCSFCVRKGVLFSWIIESDLDILLNDR